MAITTEIRNGITLFHIDHPCCQASVSQQGAQLLSWTPTGTAPVIWLSPAARFNLGSAIRGGIPVCWPWFGPHPSDATLPAHGIARSASWDLISQSEDAAGVALHFQLKDNAASRAIWPVAFELNLTLYLGATFHLAFEATHHGDAPVMISDALHTYFAVADCETVTVSGLDQCAMYDKVSHTHHTQQGAPQFSQETDRVFLDVPDTLILHDPAGRDIHIQSTGTRSAIIWNPGQAKAQQMADVGTHWQGFACVETGNALQNQYLLPPTHTHTETLTVAVHPHA